MNEDISQLMNENTSQLMNENTSPLPSILRLTAFLGTAAVLLWHTMGVAQLQPRQAAGFVVLLVAAAPVCFILLTVLADETDDLLRHKDLLVPLGLFVTASAIFNILATLPVVAALFAASWPVTILTISFALSISLIFMLLLSVVCAGWTTVLIFQLVVRGQTDLLEGIALIPLWFWRALALEVFGWGVILVLSAAALATSVVFMPFALIVTGIMSLIWNLTTVALLPVALADPRPFRESLRHGFDVSLAGMHKWTSLVIVQMLLLGWMTFIHVSYTVRVTTDTGTTHTVSTTQHTSTNWSVNSFWTGSYADSCKWHEHLMKALAVPALPLIDTLLMLLFAFLAIVIKFRIINDVYRPRLAPEMQPILEGGFGEREMCDAELRHTARVFGGRQWTPPPR
jgi:hypothetical protein